LIGFVFAQRKMVAANLDLDWVAQGRKPHQFDRRADEKAHFKKPATVFGRDVDLGNGSGATRLERGQR
jgi:hypothetical protein